MLFRDSSLVALVLTIAFAFAVDANPITVRNGRALQRNKASDNSLHRARGMNQVTAVYFMTNLASNSIVALPVADDGSVSAGGSFTSTEGAGGNEINAMTGALDGPDALGSQGSVQIVGDLLFAVNPGSDTVSMFHISREDPTQLTLIGQPAYTNGDFPVSISVSASLKLACVGNTGALSGVSCASFSHSTGLGAFDTLRSIPFGQSTPPSGPLNGISQVLFSEGDADLIVVVKSDGTAAQPGFVALYPISGDTVSASPGSSGTPAKTVALFGTTLIPGTNNVLMTDASFGDIILTLSDLSDPLAYTNITDQEATCWSTVSTLTDTGFVDDPVVSHLVEVDLTTGAIISEVPCDNGGQGMTDLKAVGDRIYALSPGNGTVPAAVTVFDISGGRGSVHSIQNFPVEGADQNAEGLAVFIS